MGQAQPINTKENLDPAILEIISEALSSGVARNIVDSVVENITGNAVDGSADGNPGDMGNRASCGKPGVPPLTNAGECGRKDDSG
ncbi:MAG: hypothetical protein ACOX4M_01590 [Acetivibrionales bacterium]|jgi:hypothetical protein